MTDRVAYIPLLIETRCDALVIIPDSVKNVGAYISEAIHNMDWEDLYSEEIVSWEECGGYRIEKD